MEQQLSHNHAHLELENADSAQKEVRVMSGEIGMLHGNTTPGAEFDVVIQDMAGREIGRKFFKTDIDRFGERIDLPVNDKSCIIKIENVRGAKAVDIFLD
jgi:hypothetical protein